MNKDIEWYIDSIRHELEKLEEGKFTGNMEFKINFKEGSPANMNVILATSVKK
jgi:hypothetical protein